MESDEALDVILKKLEDDGAQHPRGAVPLFDNLLDV
jgi:hypothetical protein